MKVKNFFVHYGPGGNAQVEEHWFNDSETFIFWDQPRLNKHNFEEICDLYNAKLKEILASCDQVHLYGHSFGCDVALMLESEYARQIQSVNLISPIRDLVSAFKNLSKTVILKNPNSTSLQEALKSLEKAESSNLLVSFWGLIGELFNAQGVFSCYWGSEEKFVKYGEVLSSCEALNMEEWQKVLTDYISNPRSTYDNIPAHKTKVVLGELDPYYDFEVEKSFWLNNLNEQSVYIAKTCGHYPHLESDKLDFFS